MVKLNLVKMLVSFINQFALNLSKFGFRGKLDGKVFSYEISVEK